MTHPVDVFVGNRLRQRRWMLGITQQELADKVGIKFQQIQKYESGANRVSASRLWDISRALSVGIGYFYDGLDEEDPGPDGDGAPPAPSGRELSELVRLYFSLPKPQRERLFELARVLVDTD